VLGRQPMIQRTCTSAPRKTPRKTCKHFTFVICYFSHRQLFPLFGLTSTTN